MHGAAGRSLRHSWRVPSRFSDASRTHFRVDAVVSAEVLRTLAPDEPQSSRRTLT
jgi:hypothetical protein